MLTNVYHLIEAEREFQRLVWPAHKHTVGEWAGISWRLAQDCLNAYGKKHGVTDCLFEMVQLAATAVGGLEEHQIRLVEEVKEAHKGHAEQRFKPQRLSLYRKHLSIAGTDGSVMAMRTHMVPGDLMFRPAHGGWFGVGTAGLQPTASPAAALGGVVEKAMKARAHLDGSAPEGRSLTVAQSVAHATALLTQLIAHAADVNDALNPKSEK